MTDLGFYRIRAFVPEIKIADVNFNIDRILEAVRSASEENVKCIVFPELCVTGYTCADLFEQSALLESAEEGIRTLGHKTAKYDIIISVGCPVIAFGERFNCAIILYKGKVLGIVPKTHIPNYGEFYEKRWFASGKNFINSEIKYASELVPFGTHLIFENNGIKIGVEICEDLWVPQPPSCNLSVAGADIILNLSASDELIGKHDYLKNLVSQQSARCRCVYAYASAGWGESSTDLVFSGNAIIAEYGLLMENVQRFTTGSVMVTKDVDIEKLRADRTKFSTFFDDYSIKEIYPLIKTSDKGKSPIENILPHKEENQVNNFYNSIDFKGNIDPMPFVPKDISKLKERCEEIINIQSYGLMRRLQAIACRKAIIGISGGLDSTLALLVTVRAFDKLMLDRKGIIGVTMPGFATTSRTKSNAVSLMHNLGVTVMEIPIGEAVAIHFRDISQDAEKFDATYENSQARERTQILMDLANKENGIVIGTGDMSELALGWCTYNGDHMSMYGVNVSIPKTLVRHLVSWFVSESDSVTSEILKDIIATPISPELIPSGNDEISQKTEDLVGPYELHDFFLYNFLRNSFSPKKIFYLACLAFNGKFDEKIILKWMRVFFRRFFSQQFKRSCLPDGPKVGSVSLSPRGDWRMPSDASSSLWIKEIDDLDAQIN